MDQEKEFSVTNELRPIHYLGSKLRILDTIKQSIDSVNPARGRVCDLFSGSGTVSHYLGYTRPVTAVDIQEYSKILCSASLNPIKLPFSVSYFINQIVESSEYAALLNAFEPLLKYERDATLDATHGQIESLYGIIENGSLMIATKSSQPSSTKLSLAMEKTTKLLKSMGLENSPSSMVTRYFGGVYFSYKQAVCIDASLEVIANYAGRDVGMKDFMLAAAISATSEIVNTVGKQFAQPLQVRGRDGKLKKNLLKKILTDRSLLYFESLGNWMKSYTSLKPMPFDTHEALRMDYQDALERLKQSDVSVVYADPPYTRYHYSRYYHVLETICLRDNPDISTTFSDGVQLSRGIYRKDRHQSPFCIRSKAGEAFEGLFSGVSELGVPLVLSYSPFSENSMGTPRMQTINQLMERAKRYYKKVDIVSPGPFMHSKLNSTDKNFVAEQEAELLIICQDIRGRG